MKILNFSHPLTKEHIAAIGEKMGMPITAVEDIRVHLNTEGNFTAQIVALVDELGISSHDWQNEPFLIVLPSLNYAAAILIAELHGRMGRFPSIVRMRPIAGALVTTYEVAEILNLEDIRMQARGRR